MDSKITKYWKKYYKNNYLRDKKLFLPSAFAKFVIPKIKKIKIVIDLGCGNGKDSNYFFKKNKIVWGLDLSNNVITKNKLFYKKQKKMKFILCDVTKKIPNIILKQKKPKCYYSRFFLHAIKNSNLRRFIKTVSKSMSINDILFVEYRTIEDRKRKKINDNHFRNYLNENKVNRILYDNNLSNTFFNKGTGLAKFKNENPFVARHIITKKNLNGQKKY